MRLAILSLCFVMLCSCGTGWCIKVDGTYQGKTGGFEYCYNPAKSSEIGLPVLNSESGSGVILDVNQVQKIMEKIDGQNAKAVDAKAQKKYTLQDMANFLKK